MHAGEQTAKAVQAFVSEAYPAALVPRLATMDSMQAFLHVEVASPKVHTCSSLHLAILMFCTISGQLATCLCFGEAAYMPGSHYKL